MQLSYAITPSAARAGLLYDIGATDIVTRTASVALPFGSFVVKAAGDGNIALPSAAPNAISSVIEGVVIFDMDTQSGLAGDGVTPGVEATKPSNILQRGRIWVYCETAFNPDADTLYVRYTANGALVPGNVRKDTDGGKAAQLGASGFLVGYKALNTLTAAGFLALDINVMETVR